MANTVTRFTDQIMVYLHWHWQQHQRPKKHLNLASLGASVMPPKFCDQITSTGAAIDIIILILVLVSCGFLITPSFTFVFSQMGEVLPGLFTLIAEVVYQAPLAYAASGSVLLFCIMVIVVYAIHKYKSRWWCNNPQCRVCLRKAVMELDIQLETQQSSCVRMISSSPIAAAAEQQGPWNGGVELGQDPKDLEAELRRIAPPNGQATLIFRAPCGCPLARFEAWGTRKPRRSKK